MTNTVNENFDKMMDNEVQHSSCPTDMKTTSVAYRTRSATAIGPKRYKCSPCGETFIGTTKYSEHLPVCPRRFKCSPCGETFTGISNYSEHLLTCCVRSPSITKPTYIPKIVREAKKLIDDTVVDLIENVVLAVDESKGLVIGSNTNSIQTCVSEDIDSVSNPNSASFLDDLDDDILSDFQNENENDNQLDQPITKIDNEQCNITNNIGDVSLVLNMDMTEQPDLSNADEPMRDNDSTDNNSVLALINKKQSCSDQNIETTQVDGVNLPETNAISSNFKTGDKEIFDITPTKVNNNTRIDDLECSLCGIVFFTIASLEKHLKLNISNHSALNKGYVLPRRLSYSDDETNRRSKDSSPGLIIDLDENESNEILDECKFTKELKNEILGNSSDLDSCHENTEKSPLERQIENVKHEMLYCKLCSYCTISKQDLSGHLNEKHEGNEGKNEWRRWCLFCRLPFFSQRSLELHLSVKHKGVKFLKSKNDTPTIKQKQIKINRPIVAGTTYFRCPYCKGSGRKMFSKGRFVKHLRIHPQHQDKLYYMKQARILNGEEIDDQEFQEFIKNVILVYKDCIINMNEYVQADATGRNATSSSDTVPLNDRGHELNGIKSIPGSTDKPPTYLIEGETSKNTLVTSHGLNDQQSNCLYVDNPHLIGQQGNKLIDCILNTNEEVPLCNICGAKFPDIDKLDTHLADHGFRDNLLNKGTNKQLNNNNDAYVPMMVDNKCKYCEIDCKNSIERVFHEASHTAFLVEDNSNSPKDKDKNKLPADCYFNEKSGYAKFSDKELDKIISSKKCYYCGYSSTTKKGLGHHYLTAHGIGKMNKQSNMNTSGSDNNAIQGELDQLTIEVSTNKPTPYLDDEDNYSGYDKFKQPTSHNNNIIREKIKNFKLVDEDQATTSRAPEPSSNRNQPTASSIVFNATNQQGLTDQVNHPINFKVISSHEHESSKAIQILKSQSTLEHPPPSEQFNGRRFPTRVNDILTLFFPISDALPCTEASCNCVYTAKNWSTTKQSLIRHLIRDHRLEVNQTVFFCTTCNKNFKFKPSAHNCFKSRDFTYPAGIVYPFKCNLCASSFPSVQGLRNHILRHKIEADKANEQPLHLAPKKEKLVKQADKKSYPTRIFQNSKIKSKGKDTINSSAIIQEITAETNKTPVISNSNEVPIPDGQSDPHKYNVIQKPKPNNYQKTINNGVLNDTRNKNFPNRTNENKFKPNMKRKTNNEIDENLTLKNRYEILSKLKTEYSFHDNDIEENSNDDFCPDYEPEQPILNTSQRHYQRQNQNQNRDDHGSDDEDIEENPRPTNAITIELFEEDETPLYEFVEPLLDITNNDISESLWDVFIEKTDEITAKIGELVRLPPAKEWKPSNNNFETNKLMINLKQHEFRKNIEAEYTC